MERIDPPLSRLIKPKYLLKMLAVGVIFACHANPQTGVETGADDPGIDSVFASWDRSGSPGCAVAVAQNGTLVYSRGYGYANLDYDIPITPQTVFDVASVTKQFVAASLNMLAREGKLSLDDDVRKWLPEIPGYDWPITLKHMVYHTSGLRDYLNLFPLAGRDDYYPISHAQILAMMSRQRALIFRPGDQYRYSNTAYMLLAQVIERAGGQSLGEMAHERIFEPLGMTGSLMYDDSRAVIPRRATGYGRDEVGRPRVVHNYNFDVAGDGQLYSTVEDLLRWDSYLHDARPAIYPAMLTEGTLNNGDPTGRAQGLFLRDYRGLRTVEHSGSSWGFRSQLTRFVGPGLSIAVACNADYADPGELVHRLADHHLADELAPASAAEPPVDDEREPSAAAERLLLAPGQLADFAGEYFSPELDAVYRFRVVADRLELRIEQELPLDAVPIAADRFEIRFHPRGWSEPQTVSLEFGRDRSGIVAGFRLSAGTERGIAFERRKRGPPTAGEG